MPWSDENLALGLSESSRVEEREHLGVVHIGVFVRHHHSLLSKTQEMSFSSGCTNKYRDKLKYASQVL